MPRTDISIDLETMGSGPRAAIIAVGMAAFDPHSGKVLYTFYRAIRPVSAAKVGEIDPATIQWWMGQSQAARAVFKDQTAVSIGDALKDVHLFIQTHTSNQSGIWGNGSSFDCVILRSAFDVPGITRSVGPCPWEYWQERDMRTVVDLAGYRKGDIERKGTHHNALDDAVHQAEVISHCIKKLKGVAA